MFIKGKKIKKLATCAVLTAVLTAQLCPSFSKITTVNAATDAYKDRYMQLWEDIHDTSNGYFSTQGIPYHAPETLIAEAVDYGHVTTSEALSYYMYLEAMYGKFTGDFTSFKKAWDTTETYMIPSALDQPNTSMSKYTPNKPATYAAEKSDPSQYPSDLLSNAPVGSDPIHNELVSAYGTSMIYGMHWLLDVDNWYGFGARGDGTSKPSYINTFQRGVQESSFEVVPQPCWDDFKFGGKNGYLDLFTGDPNGYSKQYKYTDAPDADARAVQATYWANEWAKEHNASIGTDVSKASKMGDYLRYAMFDKYFRKIGNSSQAGTGYDAAHYLMSWYYAWGGGITADWSWKIGCSHSHIGYQNPMAAWVLSTNSEFKPKSTNGARDWSTSLTRQLELYQWLQTEEGAIAGGVTNSNNGSYDAWPAGTSTFYGMGYQEHPVYGDPGSNEWFGWQTWSMQRVAEYYYKTGDVTAKAVLDKWVTWVKSVVQLNDDGTFAVPGTLNWSGQPNTWTGTATNNSNLHVIVKDSGTDLGVSASLANTLLYYSSKSGDEESRVLAKELLDRMWTLYRDDKGVATTETRADYKRIFDQVVPIPSGWTGKMPNGDVIKTGVTFLDIRSKYKLDSDYQKLLAAYKANVAPVFTYHRFWAQCEIAMANGLYSILFSVPEDSSTITPTTATFDKLVSKQANVAVEMTLNGNTLDAIKNGTTPLVAGTDYTVTDTTVTISKAYLAKQAVGTTNLTFDFSAGKDPVLVITIKDTTPSSAISPTTVTFDKNPPLQANIDVALTLNGNTFSGIKNGTVSLVKDTDYTVSDNTVTLLKEYLAKQPLGTTNLTFSFSAGLDSVLKVTIIDTSIPAGKVKVQAFNGNTSATTNGIAPKFKLTNTGTTDVKLSDVKLRYYYTIDGEQAQNFWCDWSSAGSGNVNGTFVKMATPKTGADYYLEIGFTSAAGTLSAGQSIEIQSRFSKTNWTNYTQTGDYSFDATSGNYADSTNVTGYLAGTLITGVEPK